MKELTLEMLISNGINIWLDDTKECGYCIMHYGRNHRGANMVWKEVKPVINGKYHPKSGQTKQYYIVGWSDYANTKKQISYPLSRVVYAWYKGRVPANMDVDHINNDSLDNSIDNLQLLTRGQNLAKRSGWINQWGPKEKENG